MAPLRKKPNKRAANTTPTGWLLPSKARAMASKPYPDEKALLFGFLRNGAIQMQLTAGIPIDIISVLQAFILAFIAAPAIIRTIYRLKEPDMDADAVTLRGWGG